MKLNKQNNNILMSVFIHPVKAAKTCIHLKVQVSHLNISYLQGTLVAVQFANLIHLSPY